MSEPAGWMTATSGPDTRLPSGAVQARFRRRGPVLEAQHPVLDRFYAGFVTIVGVLFTAMEPRSAGSTALGLGCIALAAYAWWRALRVWIVADGKGWHDRGELIERDQIVEVILFRGPDGETRSDFIRTVDGRKRSLSHLLPPPFTGHRQAYPESIDMFCQLAHQLAHDIGDEPVPVRVDVGPESQLVPFAHACDTCQNVEHRGQ